MSKPVEAMTGDELRAHAEQRERMAETYLALATTGKEGWGEWYRRKSEEASAEGWTALKRLHGA